MSHSVECLVDGSAVGPVLFLSEPLSFWGGVDPESGIIVDRHHPQAGRKMTGKVLAFSHGRGSSSSSSVVAEMIRLGTAPAAIVLTRPDPMIVVGCLVAAELYGMVLPVARVSADVVGALTTAATASLSPGGHLEIDRRPVQDFD